MTAWRRPTCSLGGRAADAQSTLKVAVSDDSAASDACDPSDGRSANARSKEEIMGSTQAVVDLDMQRIKKHMKAGRGEHVPEHMRPPDKRKWRTEVSALAFTMDAGLA